MAALRILSNAAAVIAEGEVMQLAAAKDLTTTEDAHLAIINAKTAALFSAAGEVGAAIADRPAQEQAALRSYGKMLGIAFQLVDDALDYAGDASKLGKSVGDDFREGKITLPVILAYRRGDQSERDFWDRVIAKGDIRDGDLEHAMQLMQTHKAIEATMERARHYGSIAKDELAIFPECAAKTALLDVVDFCIGRVN
jgi:octaprenyl-diphosphate synthase